MNKAIFCLLAASCVSASAQQNQAAGTALTIYNQDLAVVRTTVDLGLKPGDNEVTTTKVTSQLEPDSVVLRDPAGRHPVQIEEQNYDAAIATQSWMLQKYEGQTIDFKQERDGKPELVQGKILRADANGAQPLIELNGKMQFQLPGLPVFPASTDGLLLKPTLRWKIFSKDAAQFPAELSYLTHGFSWNATYNLVSAKTEAAGSGTEPVDIVGWVTISNNSGTEFTDARVKLMAGDVAVARQAGYGCGVISGLAMAQAAPVAPPPVTQKAFDDFHLYDLNRRVTLEDRETKQIEFLRVAGVPVTRKYVYDGMEFPNSYGEFYGNGAYTDSSMGLSSTKKVHIEQEFVNSKANHLGMPLPAGVVRFYRSDSDGQMEFVGENTIDHTPEDGKVRLSTGVAFDVTGQRKRMNFHIDVSERVIDESYLITVKSAKDKPANVDVIEHLFRTATWNIAENSSKYEKRDSSTIAFPITVPAHGQQQVSYTVHYSW
ncbi:MAG TPA: hypothetical protein VFW25_07585 [Silvibacterium sp.]|nr:hypothetical protein [Silvibacterium sp.]